MELPSHHVTTPLFICDSFASERFKGNQAGVCLVPTHVYCIEWSALNSLEASFGRGKPEEVPRTEAERTAEGQAYAEDRDAKMGRAFLSVAKELNLSETAFIYRLPTSRVKAVQEQIKCKVNEFEKEYEEKLREDELRGMNVTLEEMSTHGGEMRTTSAMDPSESVPGIIPSASFSIASFGASFLDTQRVSFLGTSSGGVGGLSRRTAVRRMNTQWFGLRWFTPKQEVALCGHATIAAAHIIFECSRLCQFKSTRHIVSNVPTEFFIPTQTDVLCFITKSGVISVRREDDGAEAAGVSRLRDPASCIDTYELHIPHDDAVSVQEMVPPDFKAALTATLGPLLEPKMVEDIALSSVNSIYVVVFSSVRSVFQCKPTMALQDLFSSPSFAEARRKHPKLVTPRGLVVTAYNRDEIHQGPAYGAQVISRYFAPWAGVLEDYVTGIAHSVLTPYWLHRIHGSYKVGDTLECYQASSRGGRLKCIIIGKKAERVALIGSAVTFMRGNATYEIEN